MCNSFQGLCLFVILKYHHILRLQILDPQLWTKSYRKLKKYLTRQPSINIQRYGPVSLSILPRKGTSSEDTGHIQMGMMTLCLANSSDPMTINMK